MEFLTSLTWMHWIALGLILFGMEALGASGFLFGAAVAAVGMSILTAIFTDLSVVAQLVIYAVTSLVATVVYFQVFRDAQKNDGAPRLNQRARSMVGTRFELEEVLDGKGRVQIGDTMWKIKSKAPIAAGTAVEVIGSRGMTLEVAPR